MLKMTLAAVQMTVRVGDLDWNLAHSLEMIAEAAKRGADLVCFPESVLDGYAIDHPDLMVLARPVPGQETERIGAAARKHKVWVMWSLAELTAGKVANTAVLYDPNGTMRLHYRKTHLCREEGEQKAYQSGDTYPVIQVGAFNVGAMICFDRHFPEVARTLRLNGAELILHPTASIWFEPNPEHINHAIMRTRAYENRTYVLSVNQSNYRGGSALYGPWGEVLAQAGTDEEILLTEIDRDRLDHRPETYFDLLNQRRSDLYDHTTSGSFGSSRLSERPTGHDK
jgi:predicted amidohydrolase